VHPRAVAVTVCLASFLVACSPAAYEWRGTAYQRTPPAPAIDGETTSGSPISFVDRSDAVSLVYFGYTACPDYCPATLATSARMFEELGPDADRVQFVFVTVDPSRDTVDVLRAYLAGFEPRFIGVRPAVEALPDLLAGYGASAFVEAPSQASHEHVIAHTTRLFLVDSSGLLRAHYAFDVPREDLLADVRHLLGEA